MVSREAIHWAQTNQWPSSGTRQSTGNSKSNNPGALAFCQFHPHCSHHLEHCARRAVMLPSLIRVWYTTCPPPPSIPLRRLPSALTYIWKQFRARCFLSLIDFSFPSVAAIAISSTVAKLREYGEGVWGHWSGWKMEWLFAAEYINPCKRNDPELSACIVKVIDGMRDKLISGIPELEAPSLEPLKLEQIRLLRGPRGARLDFNVTDLVVRFSFFWWCTLSLVCDFWTSWGLLVCFWRFFWGWLRDFGKAVFLREGEE